MEISTVTEIHLLYYNNEDVITITRKERVIYHLLHKIIFLHFCNTRYHIAQSILILQYTQA